MKPMQTMAERFRTLAFEEEIAKLRTQHAEDVALFRECFTTRPYWLGPDLYKKIKARLEKEHEPD